MKKSVAITLFLAGTIVGSILTLNLKAQQQDDTSYLLGQINDKIDKVLSNQDRILTEIHRVLVRVH